MPPLRFWPFMARTMVEEVHGVKYLFRVGELPAPPAVESGSYRWG
jgi:hypothetical protein